MNTHALLVIDMQVGFGDAAHWGGARNNPQAEDNLLQLMQAFRAAQLPVFHIQHASTSAQSPLHPQRPGFAWMPGFGPQPGEAVVTKQVNSAFIGTDLQAQLEAARVQRLFIAGLTTDHCVSTTTRMAGNLGFDAFVVTDATATFPRVGAAGALHPAELVHDVALASLREFAHLTTAAHGVQSLRDAARLRQAEAEAVALLDTIERAGIIAPGRSESAMSRAILELARGHTPPVHKFWHKRIVRVGRNTVETYRANPDDLLLQADDVAFVDLGPVLEDFEADLGRSYVLGQDPDKQRMVQALEPLFAQCQALYWARPQMTGAELYASVVQACEARGFRYGNDHCGHLVGAFPHERRLGEVGTHYICADNHTSMSAPAASGELRHWILELHLVDPKCGFGAFYERLI